jgi:hypothetical protein
MRPGPDRAEVTITIVLSPAVLAAARHAAAIAGIAFDKWVAELVDVRIAEVSCRHGWTHDPVRDVPPPDAGLEDEDAGDECLG